MLRLTSMIRTCLVAALLLTITACGAASTPTKSTTGTTGGSGSLQTGAITMFTKGLPLRTYMHGAIVAASGDLWFGAGNAIARVTPSGVIATFSHGLPADGVPYCLIAGPGGTVWFADIWGTSEIPFVGALR